MEGNDSDGSSGSEFNSSGDEGKLMIVSQENSMNGDVLGHENLNSKSDFAPDDSDQSGEGETSLVRTKRRNQLMSDSDEESAIDTARNDQNHRDLPPSDNESKSSESSSQDTGNNRYKSDPQKSRIRKMSTSGDESDSDANNKASSNDEESRIKSKRNKLKQKFKNLHSKKNKKATPIENSLDNVINKDKSVEYDSSSDESSVGKIKQVIKQGAEQLKSFSSLCDPDTSDEESSAPSRNKAVQKKGRKSTKLTSPKPQRMSAKQAMENMQKIKSESNRMLREKDVSLPYHRPKALTLKDIMSRKRAAVTPDGKALPIKMNDEQLKQYVEILEQRQKEVIELCKSDTEEEEDEKTENNTSNLPEISSLNDTLYDDLSKTESQINRNADQDLQNSKNISPYQGIINEDIGTANMSNEVILYTDDTNVNREVCDTEAVQADENVNHINITSKTDDLEPMSVVYNLDEHISKELESKAVDENNSMEMELVYNDSVEETNETTSENNEKVEGTEYINVTKNRDKPASEVESQLISLRYDTEKSDINTDIVNDIKNKKEMEISEELKKNPKNTDNDEPEMRTEEIQNDGFSDDDMIMEDIDALIENAEIALSPNNTGIVNSPMLIKEPMLLTGKPRLTGAPGMVIDLDGTDPLVPKKLSGVELLKERFVYFAKLKTPEELGRDREKRIKPGMQHLKLKLELEQQIAEQRSLEWAKRLEEGKQHQKELNSLRGEGSDAEEDIDAIEAKLEEKEATVEKESDSESEEEEEIEEEFVNKPRKRNPMVDDEAEESDCDDESDSGRNDVEQNENKGIEENNDDADNEADESEEESSEESEESEEEQENKPKKGRILKAFEDSDDEDMTKNVGIYSGFENNDMKTTIENIEPVANSQITKTTQDDELHLAQKSVSEDLFTSQESVANSVKSKQISNITDNSFEEKQLGTQTFSILETTTENTRIDFPMPNTLSIPRNIQSFSYDDNLDAVVGMCSGSFSQTQNLVPPSQIAAEGEGSISQAIGDDVLALCTGHFYDNQFVSQEESEYKETSSEGKKIDKMNFGSDETTKVDDEVNIEDTANKQTQNNLEHDVDEVHNENKIDENTEKKNELEDPNLKSVLDELNDPEFDSPKPNKYFVSNANQDKENKQSIANAQFKKKFIIDSDEEDKEQDIKTKRKKKIKKKKIEQRALQISDEEDEVQEEAEEYESELEENDEERIVEYDSEENEVIVQPRLPKKKRKMGEFFEQEAELTSEDEWVGSGDEDEAGLDRMEREEGDDDTFNEKQLQRELGQIHMRDVLDQDKREVRLIQELLFEDGDLGGGSRQRKFRWRNADGEEETDTMNDEFGDTQEEEFESEEQWRKQRHEREMFLKSLKHQEEPEQSLDISVTRTSIIKANLSKNTSNFFVEVNSSIEECPASVSEKKTVTAKDIPSPKKPFTIFQQNYHGSLLTRGRGALARLAALATPLTNDDDTPKVGSLKPTSKSNFVFASIDAPTPDEDEPKVNKRKAEGNTGTSRLVKKLRTEDKQNLSKSSLLDHIKI